MSPLSIGPEPVRPVVHRICLGMALGPVLLAGSLAGQSPASERTTTSEGREIRYQVAGSGPTALVFLHGWACDHSFWDHQVAFFSRDYRVVTPDLAGHGGTPSGADGVSIESLAEDVEAVVRAESLDRVVLVGHSLGGVVALVTAARLPGTAVGVVGVDSLHDVEQRLTSEMIDPIVEQLEGDYPAAMRQLTAPLFDADDGALAESVIARAQAADPAAMAALVRAFQHFDTQDALRRAKVPVHCINAAPGRPGTLPTESEHNRRHGDFTVELIPEVGHFLMLEQPDELNRRLAAVLARWGGNSQPR